MLTVRQHQVLEFLRQTRDATGVMPSTREIQQHFGFASQTAAVEVLRALERKGSLRRLPGKARGIVLTEPGGFAGPVRVPIHGTVLAGGHLDASQAEDGHLYVDPHITGGAPAEALSAARVMGDSMSGACIEEGDFVILDTSRTARDGDVVAAVVNGERLLKRYVVTDGRAWLRSENPERFQLIPAADAIIQAVMTGLLRPGRPA